MELGAHHEDREPAVPADMPPGPGTLPGNAVKRALTISIAVLICVVGYFSYVFVSRSAEVPAAAGNSSSKLPRVIQLDVLNGSGAKGVAARFTRFLRSAGFDVVEMKNYKVSTVPHTLVVDRIGDLSTARRVAAALGVAEKNIVQQINPDYFVDVSVIIGGDFSTLQSSH